MKNFFILLIASLSISAHAANWVDLGYDDSRNFKFLIDASSIEPYNESILTRDGDYYSGFVKFIYNDSYEHWDLGWRVSIRQFLVGCHNNTMSAMGTIVYTNNGNVIDSVDMSAMAPFNLAKVYPETVAEEIVYEVCALKP